jgi:5'-3' exonuclease
LISSDKDWDLLISDKVSRFSTVTRKETTVHNWDEHYDFEIPDYITFKCLTGDKGDNVPGIPGIGPKRAVQLMEQYGDVFDIYNSCPIDGKYKYIQNLNENSEQLLMNVELMDLLTYCDEAIGKENTEVINTTLKRVLNENRL